MRKDQQAGRPRRPRDERAETPDRPGHRGDARADGDPRDGHDVSLEDTAEIPMGLDADRESREIG
ncbi:hypothetical protein AB0C14_26875 [Microbispora hainanensis]|uniref:hypothetical protein n=1 Tax=Microbispora hainanensis TaxID=568844 RepID=UPI0033D03434